MKGRQIHVLEKSLDTKFSYGTPPGHSPKNIHNCDPFSTPKWPPYGSRYPLPSYLHYRDPQIETLPRVPPIFNMILSHWDPLLSNPWVACHCDHVLIYLWAATEWPPYGSHCPLFSYFHYGDPQIETLPRVSPVFNMVLSHWDPLLSKPSDSLSW